MKYYTLDFKMHNERADDKKVIKRLDKLMDSYTCIYCNKADISTKECKGDLLEKKAYQVGSYDLFNLEEIMHGVMEKVHYFRFEYGCCSGRKATLDCLDEMGWKRLK